MSVMLIAVFIVAGLFVYVERFLRDGERWASYFSRLNSLSEGMVTDRNGVVLAAFTANDNRYNEDRYLLQILPVGDNLLVLCSFPGR